MKQIQKMNFETIHLMFVQKPRNLHLKYIISQAYHAVYFLQEHQKHRSWGGVEHIYIYIYIHIINK